MLKIIIFFTLVSVASFADPLERLDPHGSSKLRIKEINSLQGYGECSVCHAEAKGKIKIKGNPSSTCSDCHNKGPHSGAIEHTNNGVSCVSCHGVHRAESPYDSMVKKSCTDCHKPNKIPMTQKKFSHTKHVVPFDKLGVTCMNCHSFKTKATEPSALGKPIAGGGLKAKTEVCLNCHGTNLKLPFSQKCATCHNDKLGTKANHPSQPGINCLECHTPKGFSHGSLAFEGTDKCNQCHQNKIFKHPDVSKLSELNRAKGLKLGKHGLECLSCHSMHSLKNKNKTIAFCASCHGQKGEGLYQKFHQKMK